MQRLLMTKSALLYRNLESVAVCSKPHELAVIRTRLDESDQLIYEFLIN